MMAVSLGAILALTLAIGAMALGFGALYPQFETENAAQIPTSFGGLVFMMATIALLAIVIVLLAGPVYAYLRAANAGETVQFGAGAIGSFIGAAVLCAVATIAPLKASLRKMEQFEF
jgi:ABC-2 type transport system permease protein